jgi:putative ABC transport system permease protein
MINSMQEQINQTSTLIECQTTSGPGLFSGRPSGVQFSRSGQALITDTIAKEIRSIEGVKEVVPFVQASSNVTTSETMNAPNGRTFTISIPLYTITGLSLNSSFINDYSILPTNITDGRNLQEGDTGVLVMSSNLTDYFGVGVDGKIDVNGESFTVVGVCKQAGQGRFETRNVYMNISDAQRVMGLGGNVSTLDVYAQDTSDVDEIAQTIEALYTDISVTTYKDRLTQLQNMQTMYNQTLTNAESTLSQTQTTATQEIIIAVAATSLIVLVVMLYTVRERTKEIGTLKAIGFSNWSVLSQFVLEGVFMSLVAAVVGIAIGSVGAPTIMSILLPSINPSASFGLGGGRTFTPGSSLQPSVSATLDLQTMLLTFGAAALLGAVGALYPAWRAAKTSPMEALRHE